MKHKHNAGFSLIEILVAIVLLGAIVVPTCTSLVMSVRMNARTEEMLQAQLAVSSAVEILMAEGIDPDRVRTEADAKDYDWIEVNINGVKDWADQLPEVSVKTKKGKTVTVNNEETVLYYEVTVADNENLVSVTTFIRADAEEGGTE